MYQPVIERMKQGDVPTRPSRCSSEPVRTPAETRLFRAIETAFAVGCDDLRAATRVPCKIAFARQTGMYLARVALGMTLSDAGHLFGRDRTTASHACRIVEDLRDDPGFDALLHAMETFMLRPDSRDGSGL